MGPRPGRKFYIPSILAEYHGQFFKGNDLPRVTIQKKFYWDWVDDWPEGLWTPTLYSKRIVLWCFFFMAKLVRDMMRIISQNIKAEIPMVSLRKLLFFFQTEIVSKKISKNKVWRKILSLSIFNFLQPKSKSISKNPENL